MNGAESLVRTLLASDVKTCFANPGTSEMHFVAALDRIPGMRCILGLTESVVTGAADGFGRMMRDPAVTLLHCGPGLANGLSNLHNARRAQAPVVNIVGDQATYHQKMDPPLASDAIGWARGVSAWTRSATTSATVGRDAAAAIQAARSGNGQIATLLAPADTCWDEGGVPGEKLAALPPPTVPAHRVREIANVFRNGESVFLLLGGPLLDEQLLANAKAIASATGAKVMAQTFNGRVERGHGRAAIARMPYSVDQAIAVLAGTRNLVLAGAAIPAAPFAYPEKPGALAPDDATIHVLARPDEDVAQALAALAEELSVTTSIAAEMKRPEAVTAGGISAEAVTQTLAALMPEDSIIIDESVSFGRPFFNGLSSGHRHDWLQITGGAIGNGFPMATGAAVACPGRRVIALQADGAGLFTVQSLWTQAREKLAVTTVVLSNRKYQILLGELANVGANPGRTALDMLDIGRPDIDWVGLARAFGVEAAKAENMEQFTDLLQTANERSGPFLIELMTA
jgi:acetolactate synthase I/II/III large subunit